MSDSQSRLQLVGQTSPQQIKRYLVNLKENQELVLDVPQTSDVSLEIIAPNGQVVKSGVKSWRGPVPSSGEYKINVIAPKKPTNFRLIINVGAK
ncbi:MAG TPA: hypothetical protein DCP31_30095 [Cyanobacteria bacterium UBA8543]|nr:hypothetical protein [Cyanobacteria bacterium UBA8543]